MAEKKYIRFIDSNYKTLFHIEDRTNIIVTYQDRETRNRLCRYIDEYHTEIGGTCYHICQWAELMERNGNTYRPESYITDLEFYPRRYLTPVGEQQRPPYYIIDETQSHYFGYAPKGSPGKKYCIADKLLGERDNDFCLGNERIFGGNLKELRPQDLGFNLEKIKAITGRKPKTRQGHER